MATKFKLRLRANKPNPSQHHAQTSARDTARTTIVNFILDFEKPGTIYNCNTHTIVCQSQQNPSPSFCYAST